MRSEERPSREALAGATVAAAAFVAFLPALGGPAWPRESAALVGSDVLFLPLSRLSWALDRLLWGDSMSGWRAQSLLLHAGSAVLVLRLARRALSDLRWAAAAALLFALHPMRADAVGDAAARAVVLSGFLSLLTVELALEAEGEGWRPLACFAAACAAHPAAAALPLLSFFDDGPAARAVRRDSGRWALTAWVFVAAAAADRDLAAAGDWLPPSVASVAARCATAPLRALLSSATLWSTPHPSVLHAMNPWAALAAAAALGGSLAWSRRAAPAATAWPVFVLLLLPFAAFDPESAGRQGLGFADRWTYLPSAALALGVVAALRSVAGASAAAAGRGAPWVAAAVLLPLALRASVARRDPAASCARAFAADPADWECGRASGADAAALRRAMTGWLGEHGHSAELYARGVALAESQRYPEALDHLVAAAESDPTSFLPPFEAAFVYSKLGDDARAAEWASKAAALSPADASVRNNLGFYYLRLDRPKEAAENLEKALAVDPNNAMARNNLVEARRRLDRASGLSWTALIDRGNSMIAAKKYDEAVAAFQASVDLHPQNPAALYDIGFALSLKGDVEGAIARTRDAVALDPRSAGARNNLGFFLLQKGRYLEAVPHLEAAVSLDPASALARNNLAAARQKAALLTSGRSKEQYATAQALFDAAHYEEALVFFEAAARSDPKSDDAPFMAGYTCHQLGRLDCAISWTAKAVAIAPEKAPLRNNLGFFYGEAGRHADAVEQLEASVRLAPEDPRARNNLYNARLKLGALPAIR